MGQDRVCGSTYVKVSNKISLQRLNIDPWLPGYNMEIEDMTVSCKLVSLGNGGHVLRIDFSDGNSVIRSKTLQYPKVHGIVVTSIIRIYAKCVLIRLSVAEGVSQ